MLAKYVKLFVRDNAKVFCRFRGLKIFSGSKSSELLRSIRCKNIDLHLLTFIGEYGCFTMPRGILMAHAISIRIRSYHSIAHLTTKMR